MFSSNEKKEAKLWEKIKSDDECWDVAHYSIQGNRRTMEDAHAILKSYGGQKTCLFAGVFDGHSGTRCAKFVSENLPQAILDQDDFENSTELGIKKAFSKVDTLWLEKAKKESKEEKPWEDGSTAVVCIILNKTLFVANTGDSRAFLVKGGEIQQLTTDQKPDDPLEKQRIEKAGGTVVNGRIGGSLSVARAFGDYPFKRPEYNCITVEPEVLSVRLGSDIEWILVACDGLYEEMSEQEVQEFVSSRLDKMSIKEITKLLVEEALELGSQDNISVILVKIEKGFQKLMKKATKYEDKKSKPCEPSLGTPKKKDLRKSQQTGPKDEDANGIDMRKSITIEDPPKKKNLLFPPASRKRSPSVNEETDDVVAGKNSQSISPPVLPVVIEEQPKLLKKQRAFLDLSSDVSGSGSGSGQHPIRQSQTRERHSVLPHVIDPNNLGHLEK
jgi:protein phosphatase 1B